MDGMTFKERIVQSVSAKRMVDAVSPIYEDSYAGCWLFEDIGREWDRLWELIDQLPDQLFPQTATWMLSLWERRYAITPNEGDTIEVRRQRIEEFEAYPKPFTPWTLDNWVNITTGRNVVVVDNIAPYTFGVYISTHPNSGPLDIEKVKTYINQHKHSHMSYMLTFQSEERILIGVETSYWRYNYGLAGTMPYRNITSGGEKRLLRASANGTAYKTRYKPCGVTSAGRAIL